jgi:peptidoglycan hydrolase-like protein with peptidoglycan-binding domain
MMRHLALVIAAVALLTSACSERGAETRAREAADKIKASMLSVEGKALAQKVPIAELKTVQLQLRKLHEYQGEINGELDAVTVNSIEAFQRSQGVEADGMLTAKTRQLLEEAAAKPTS